MSIVETVYALCACSPLGKVKKVSQPYAPGQTPVWTVYNYDERGRTKSVIAPDGVSTTTYDHKGNTVTVTPPNPDGAAYPKWKKYTMDAFGNVTQVVEPKDGVGNTYTTTYGYDILDHLTSVSMPRDGVTQTRTFNYLDPVTQQPTAFLQSADNPENGRVSYTYYPSGKVHTRSDAKGQMLTYEYDSYLRLSTVSSGGNVLRTYYYDTNTFDPTFSGYAAGRLTAIQYADTRVGQFVEMYSYTAAGLPNKKRLRWTVSGVWERGAQVTRTLDLNSTHGYDNEGRLTSVSYPSTNALDGAGTFVTTPGPAYTYAFDSMHRPNGMTDATNTTVVNGLDYGPANELKAISYFGSSETRQYNSMLQMTDLTICCGTGTVSLKYTFSATQNNGKITKQKDNISGEEVQYTYDSLSRLITAATTQQSDLGSAPPWGLSYGFDGFGNLGSKTLTKGSGYPIVMTIDSEHNKIVGQSYDLNGNVTSLPNGLTAYYDAENRMTSATNNNDVNHQYGYDAGNRRIWKWSGARDFYGNQTAVELSYYGPDGRLMGKYSTTLAANTYGQVYLLNATGQLSVYFAGKFVARGTQDLNYGVRVNSFRQDRLGSATDVKMYPYGEEKQADGQAGYKFATYWRDSETNLDYAMNRYYTSQWARFLTPDPYVASGGVGDPNSWNRYSYTRGDPANRTDRSGLRDEDGDEPESPCDPDPDHIGMIGSCYPTLDSGERRQKGGPTLKEEDWNTVKGKFQDGKRRAQDLFKGNLPPNCYEFLASLTGRVGDMAAHLGVVVSRLSQVSFANGWGSNVLINSVVLGNNPLERDRQGVSPQATVGDALAGKVWGDGVSAVAELGGPSLPGSHVWVDPSAYVNVSPAEMAAVVMHESLHNQGFTDTNLNDVLGISGSARIDTHNITLKIWSYCFSGGGR